MALTADQEKRTFSTIGHSQKLKRQYQSILRALRLTRAAELVEAAVKETLTSYAFTEEHWRRIRTNNPLERILREVRRRTRVVGVSPRPGCGTSLALPGQARDT